MSRNVVKQDFSVHSTEHTMIRTNSSCDYSGMFKSFPLTPSHGSTGVLEE